MSLQTMASQFVELCNQCKNFDVMHTMYAPDIVSVEPSGEETAGKTPVIQKSEHWQANNTIVGKRSEVRSSTAPTSSPSTSPSTSHPKPPASGSRARNSSTMASDNGTSHPIRSEPQTGLLM